MGWSSRAKAAAAEEYGKRNWHRYAARRRTVATLWLGAGALAGLVLLARAGAREVGPRVAAMSLPHPSAGWLLAAGLGLAVVLAVRWGVRAARPYRVPRRRYRRW
jgi:hypothetical protein